MTENLPPQPENPEQGVPAGVGLPPEKLEEILRRRMGDASPTMRARLENALGELEPTTPTQSEKPQVVPAMEQSLVTATPIENKEDSDEIPLPAEELRKGATFYELVHAKHPTKFNNYMLFYLVDGELKGELVKPGEDLKPLLGESLTNTVRSGLENEEDIEGAIVGDLRGPYRGGEIERHIKVVRRNGKIEIVETGEFVKVSELEIEGKKANGAKIEPVVGIEQLPEETQVKSSKEELVVPLETEDKKAKALEIALDRQREKVSRKKQEQSRDAESEAWDAYGRTGKELQEVEEELRRLEKLDKDEYWNELEKRWETELVRLDKSIQLAKRSKYSDNAKNQEIIRNRLEKAGPMGVLGVFPEEAEVDIPEPEISEEEALAQQLYEKRLAAIKKSIADLPPPEPDSADAWGRENDRLQKELEELQTSGPTAFLARAREAISKQREVVDQATTVQAKDDAVPTPETTPIVEEKRKEIIKPQDLRPGSTYYELISIENSDTGEKTYYLYHFNSKEKVLVREQVDETGIVNINPDTEKRINVKSRNRAITEIDRIVKRESEEGKYKNYKLERHIPIYEEEPIAPDELAENLITGLVDKDKEKTEKKKSIVLQDFEQQASHVGANLEESLGEYEIAQEKVNEASFVRKTIFGPSLEAKRQNYEKLFDLALHDYELAYRNMNSYFESKIKEFPIDPNDTELQRFNELGNLVGEVYREGIKEGLNPKEAAEKMQKYAKVIEQRLEIFKKFDDKYGEKPKPEAIPEIVTMTEVEASAVEVNTPSNKVGEPAQEGRDRQSRHKRLDQLREAARQMPLVGRQAEVRSEIPTGGFVTEPPRAVEPTQYRPDELRSERPVERPIKGVEGEREDPVIRSIKYFLQEQDPSKRKVVKEVKDYKGRPQTTYSFFRIRQGRDGGNEMYSFTLLSLGNPDRGKKPLVRNHGKEILGSGNFDQELSGHLQKLQTQLGWTSYEVLGNLPPELEEILRNTDNLEIYKNTKKKNQSVQTA